MVELKSIKMKVPELKEHEALSFARWWTLFRAYAELIGFNDMLEETKSSELPEVEAGKIEVVKEDTKVLEDVEHTEEQKKALERNAAAMASFHQAFQNVKMIDCSSFLTGSINKNWPKGKSWEVVKELYDEFIPKGLMGRVQQTRDLAKIRMGKYDNPRDLFTQIREIEARYGTRSTLTEEDKLAAVMTKMPEQYLSIVQALRANHKQNQNTESEPPLETIRTQMIQYYQQQQDLFERKKRNKGVEIALYATGGDKGKRKSKGKGNARRCYHCGEVGHIKRDCPKLKGIRQKKCSYCGRIGHVEAECWKKHPELRPQSQLEARPRTPRFTIPRPMGKDRRDDDDEVAGIVFDNEIHLGLIDIAVDEFAITKVAGVAIKQEDISLSDEEGDHNKTRADYDPTIKQEEPDTEMSRSPDIHTARQETESGCDSSRTSETFEYITNFEERRKFDEMFDKFPHEHEKPGRVQQPTRQQKQQQRLRKLQKKHRNKASQQNLPCSESKACAKSKSNDCSNTKSEQNRLQAKERAKADFQTFRTYERNVQKTKGRTGTGRINYVQPVPGGRAKGGPHVFSSQGRKFGPHTSRNRNSKRHHTWRNKQRQAKFRKTSKFCGGPGARPQRHKKARNTNGWSRAPRHTYNRFWYDSTRNQRRNLHRAMLANKPGTTVKIKVGHMLVTVETEPTVNKADSHPRCNKILEHKPRNTHNHPINHNLHGHAPPIGWDDMVNDMAEELYMGNGTALLNTTHVENHLSSKGTDKDGDPDGTNMLFSPVIWIADTGASCHITNSAQYSVPSKRAGARLNEVNDSLDASGNKMRHTALVDISGTVYSKGRTSKIKLTDCRFGASKFNLCSVTKLTDNGWTMRGDSKGIRLNKGNQEIHFNIPIKTADGKLWAIRIDRTRPSRTAPELAFAAPAISLEQAHSWCGHTNLRNTKKTAAHLGWKLTRTPFRRCEACAIAKARQANLGKGETKEPSTIGELWYVDGAQLKNPKHGIRKTTDQVHFPASNCFTLAVEHKTGALLLSWATTKTGFVDDFCQKFHRLANTYDRNVRRIRCDDGKENLIFQKKINGENWKRDIQFEFTAKTPQRNSRVETKIFNISNKTRAAMEAANIPNKFRYLMFALFSKWCVQTDMLEVVTIDGVSQTKYEHLFGKLPAWTRKMQVAGMAGVVKTHSEGTPKVAPRGQTCLFAYYSTDHAGDCYVMFNPSTLKTIHSRDILWLNRMYFPQQSSSRAPIILQGPSSRNLLPPLNPVDEGSVSDTDSSTGENDDDAIDEEEVENSENEEEVENSENESDTESDSESESESTSDDDLGDNTGNLWRHPQETITFGPRRSSRVSRRTKAADGTPLQAPSRKSRDVAELAAASIEASFVEATGLLGEQELRRAAPDFKDTALEEEEFLLLTMTKQEKMYRSIEKAFGYKTKKGEFHLVAAALEDFNGEIFLVGATGKNYGNTAELKVMTYEEAMATVDKEEWDNAVKLEYEKMKKYNVFEVVHPKDIPKGTKIFDSTWAMKKKADGTFRARNAIRGFQQVDGQHYDSHDKSSPVATEVGIKVVFVIVILMAMYQHLVDVEGAFLNGVFQEPDKHKIYMKVPKAYRKYYPSWAVLLLLKTQYGTIQAALQYYRECVKALEFLGFKRNPAEPCLFYKWEQGQLLIFALWVDDCCISGPKELVMKTVKEFTSLWDCKDLGELKEYVGCKVERDELGIRLTQPVKVQRFIDEFGCTGGTGPSKRAPSTPAEPGSVLEFKEGIDTPLKPELQTQYRSGVGILLHMMRWSRPDILNAVRELSTQMQRASKSALKAMKRVMNFVISTKNLGYTFKPNKSGKWSGKKGSKRFKILGKCDSEYAKHSSRRSVNAGITYLEGAPVKQFSKMMPIVALSTTEAELYSAVLTAQDMMFVYHILKGFGLEVELPMVLLCDNKGAVDLANNWSVGGRTRHVDVKQNYLRELKENGFMRVEWRSGEEMTPDIHTKNVSKQLFDRFSKELVS